MALRTATAEGYVDAAAITLANTGSGTPFDLISVGGGSITATTALAIKGYRSYLCAGDSTTLCFLAWTTLAASVMGAGKIYWKPQGAPTAAHQLLRVSNGGGGILNVALSVKVNGGLQILDATGTAVWTSDTGAGNSGNVLTQTGSVEYRHELSISCGSGTTDTVILKTYVGDSATENTGLGTTVNGDFGTTSIGRVAAGKNNASTSVPAFAFEFSWTDGTTALPGPSTETLVPNAVAAVGASVTATVQYDASNGSTNYRINWGDGATAGPQASKTFTHTYAAAGTYTITTTTT